MIYHFKGIPIFYQTTGQGPVVVLLHGFLERSTMWFRLIPELMKKNTVIALDLPGHGKSGCIAETHSMELMAEVVFSLLKSLKIETAAFIGHSMGGYVALAFAEAYEPMMERLTLLNSTSRADNPERIRNRERALEVISENKKLFISTAISNLFTETARQQYPSEIATLKEQAFAFPTEGIQAAIRGMKVRKDRTWVLAKFRREKILICGDEDPVVPLSDSRAIASETQCQLKVLHGGHMSWVENTSEMLKFCI